MAPRRKTARPAKATIVRAEPEVDWRKKIRNEDPKAHIQTKAELRHEFVNAPMILTEDEQYAWDQDMLYDARHQLRRAERKLRRAQAEAKKRPAAHDGIETPRQYPQIVVPEVTYDTGGIDIDPSLTFGSVVTRHDSPIPDDSIDLKQLAHQDPRPQLTLQMDRAAAAAKVKEYEDKLVTHEERRRNDIKEGLSTIEDRQAEISETFKLKDNLIKQYVERIDSLEDENERLRGRRRVHWDDEQMDVDSAESEESNQDGDFENDQHVGYTGREETEEIIGNRQVQYGFDDYGNTVLLT